MSDLEFTIKYIHSLVGSRGWRKLAAIFLNTAVLVLMAVPAQAGLRVVAYYPSWLKAKYPCTQIDYSRMTHIAQAFVWLNTNGTLDVAGDWSFYPELVKEAHAHGVKIVVSVGGGGRGTGNFGAMANDAVARSNFVQQLTAFCASNNYDGADIDWESPANASDMANFTTLLKELRASFTTANPHWTLSAAVRSRPWAGRWLDIDQIKGLLDWVGVMTYDYHGPWSKHSGLNAPLYGAEGDPCGLSDCVDGSVHYYLSRDLPKDKLLVGLPFYGYQFCSKKLYATNTAGVEITYADAMQRISNDWTRVWDNTSRVPYVVNSDHTLVASYDDPMSISNKCDYVVVNGLGGVIIWALGLDSYAGETPLLDVVGSSLLTSSNSRQHYANNGTWLDYAYLGNAKYWTNLPQVAAQMKENRVSYWFLNVGSLDGNGKLVGGVSNVVHFLNTVKSWEDKNHYHFQVFAWLNANWPKVSVTNSTVRANIVEECEKLVSAEVPNSYIVGANRAFDGIQLDYEPCGEPNKVFDSLAGFFDEVHTKFAAIGAGGKLTSFTAEKYGTNHNEWSWSSQYYYEMARHVDLLCAMTYDTGIKVGSDYQDWMEYQTTNVLRAVSGKCWDNDAQHPAPTNRVKVMIGFPAFPNSKWHTNAVENVIFASAGVKAALADLSKRGDNSAGYFEGAAVYAHSDGTGANGYANNGTDWRWFKEHWLGE